MYLIYMYKKDLALNNQQWLICHKTQPNQIRYIWYIYIYIYTSKVQVKDTPHFVQTFSNVPRNIWKKNDTHFCYRWIFESWKIQSVTEKCFSCTYFITTVPSLVICDSHQPTPFNLPQITQSSKKRKKGTRRGVILGANQRSPADRFDKKIKKGSSRPPADLRGSTFQSFILF